MSYMAMTTGTVIQGLDIGMTIDLDHSDSTVSKKVSKDIQIVKNEVLRQVLKNVLKVSL